jgi:hypothetical protein
VPRMLLLATLACALLLPGALALRLNRTVEESIPPHSTARLRSGLDECRLEGRTLFIRGWAYVEGDTGVRQVHVYAGDARGKVLRIPFRVERRLDVAESAGRPMERDAIHDGFSAASSRVKGLLAPITITVTRVDSDGHLHGARHACG